MTIKNRTKIMLASLLLTQVAWAQYMAPPRVSLNDTSEAMISSDTPDAQRLNPPPADARYEIYVYTHEKGRYVGVEPGMAYPGQVYTYPAGEVVYYCKKHNKNPENDMAIADFHAIPGNENKRRRLWTCCDAVLDGIREIFVCTDRSCADGEFRYLDNENRVVGTSLKHSIYADPHLEHESHLTRFRVCSGG